MSQRNVEAVLGRLLTDEAFRRRFAGAPVATLQGLVERGMELTDCECRALVVIDMRELESFAETLHPGIQKVELEGVRQ